MGRMRGWGGTITSLQNLGRKWLGLKNQWGKRIRVTRKSVATAGGHRRKSQSMWCWMKVTKEGFLAQDGPEPAIRGWGGSVGRGTGWGWLKDSWSWSCCHHPCHSLCLPLLSTGKLPQRAYSKAETRLHPENPQKWQTASVSPFVFLPLTLFTPIAFSIVNSRGTPGSYLPWTRCWGALSCFLWNWPKARTLPWAPSPTPTAPPSPLPLEHPAFLFHISE